MAPPTSALAARRQKRRALAQLLLLGALCSAIRLTSITPYAFFAPPSPVDQLPVSKLPLAESQVREGSVTPQSSRMDKFWKAARFLKLALGSEEFVALIKNRGELEEKADVAVFLADKGEYYPYSKKGRKAFVIAGDEKNVLAALQQILPDGNTNTTTYFIVPKQVKPFLLANNFESMNNVKDSTSSRIVVEFAGFEALVRVQGPGQAAAVAVAERLLAAQAEIPHNISDLSTLNYLGCSTRGLQGPCDVFVTIPDSQIGSFVGKNGETMKRTQRMHNVKMELDKKLKAADGSGIVKISGTVGDVHAAHIYILERFISRRSESGSNSE